MEQTEIQKLIEKNVTNGLGYDSSTYFVKCKEPSSEFKEFDLEEKVLGLKKEYYKNTKEGLQRHLGHLDRIINPSNPSLRYNSLLIAVSMALMMSTLPLYGGHPNPQEDKYTPNLGIDQFYL